MLYPTELRARKVDCTRQGSAPRLAPTRSGRSPCTCRGGGRVFIFFNRSLGCGGSLVVSLIGTLLLLALVRACSGGAGMW